MSLNFDKEKRRKVKEDEETEGIKGRMKESSFEEYSLFFEKRMLLWLHDVYFLIVVSLKMCQI